MDTVNNRIPERKDRFISNCTETANNIGAEYNEYRYGECYFYCDQHKGHVGHIKPKFKTMRKEITENELQTISIR